MPDTSDFDFELPPELIAQHPSLRRGESRMLTLDRKTGAISHRAFSDIADYFSAGDCLVLNNTKVVPARVFGKKKTGGRVELLFTGEGGLALTKPAVAEGTRVFFEDGSSAEAGPREADGARRFFFEDGASPSGIMEKYGVMPLPPYIKRKNPDGETIARDAERYQTVYAKITGSIAAPTAGLHFTRKILDALKSKGAETTEITLHVGLGTFKSVTSSKVDDHKMLPETFELGRPAAESVNRAVKSGKAVAAVGTTCVRTLETLAENDGTVRDGKGRSSLFIYPGYNFKTVGRLLTNFHLPRSTPLFLAAAFCGRDLLFRAYREAIKERYRFFSYGDAMLIL